MQTKLTLSMDPSMIAIAKQFAFEQDTSLSRLVELFFHKLATISKVSTKPHFHPITTKLLGSVIATSKKTDRELIVEYLEEKYL